MKMPPASLTCHAYIWRRPISQRRQFPPISGESSSEPRRPYQSNGMPWAGRINRTKRGS